jgi:hypothetical protein
MTVSHALLGHADSESGTGRSSVVSYLPSTVPGNPAALAKAAQQLAAAQMRVMAEQRRADQAEYRAQELHLRLSTIEGAMSDGSMDEAMKQHLRHMRSLCEEQEDHAKTWEAELAHERARAEAAEQDLARARIALEAAQADELRGDLAALTRQMAILQSTLAATSAASSIAAAPVQVGITLPSGLLTLDHQSGAAIREAAIAAAAESHLPLAVSMSLAWEPDGVATPVNATSNRGPSSALSKPLANHEPGDASAAITGAQDLVADIDREITARISASMRLKVGLLGWFCKNLRKRCHMEVFARCAMSAL